MVVELSREYSRSVATLRRSRVAGSCRVAAFGLLLTVALVFGPAASASTYTIVPGGAAVVVTTTASGETAMLTFPGTAGQRISLKISSDTIGQADISIVKPDATNLVNPTLFT